MRKRFCRISWSSPRIRRRPGRCSSASSVERGAQAGEGLLPPGVAEVVEPGGGDGGGPERRRVERDDGAPVVAEAAPEGDHLLHPGAAGRRGPGHGRSRYPQRGRMAGWTLLRSPSLSVDELVDLLATVGPARQLSPTVAVSQLDHALQTAALLEQAHRDDAELAVAGLVHDIGHLLPGGTDEAHAGDAATAVRAALGERVAGIVGLHVEAKRYLVGAEGGYDGELSNDSVVSLRRQGGSLGAEDAEAFARLPLAGDAVALRRADDRGKAEGLEVHPLDWWVPRLRAVSEQAGRGP